jgi:hypothetical protein
MKLRVMKPKCHITYSRLIRIFASIKKLPAIDNKAHSLTTYITVNMYVSHELSFIERMKRRIDNET